MGEPTKCTVKTKVTFDNGDYLEFDFSNLKPDTAVAMVELFKTHRLEEKDAV